MVNTYKCTDTIQLTDHFNVQEFCCKCGGSHDISITLDGKTYSETLTAK